TECLVLSPDFKLPDENQILLRIPRQDNMYSFDIKNIVPKESLTCLLAKATSDESMLWHRRLGHINFKNINKLVKENLVRGLPLKHFENDQTCWELCFPNLVPLVKYLVPLVIFSTVSISLYRQYKIVSTVYEICMRYVRKRYALSSYAFFSVELSILATTLNRLERSILNWDLHQRKRIREKHTWTLKSSPWSPFKFIKLLP
ncbi:putative ribonuclease H-like domain-containing protein, partial [Tanacetum coccineum]